MSGPVRHGGAVLVGGPMPDLAAQAAQNARNAENAAGAAMGPVGRALLSFWTQAAAAGVHENPDVELGEAAERLRQLVEPQFEVTHDSGWQSAMTQVGGVTKRWDTATIGRFGPPARLETVLWAKQAAGALVALVSQQARDWIRVVTVTGLREGWSPQVVADSLRRRVPLTVRQVEALSRFERNLAGQKTSKIRQLVNRQADAYRRDRATTIARTELLSAHNAGATQAWQDAALEGLIPATTRRLWVITKDCKTCSTCRRIVGDRAIAPDVVTPFQVPTSNGATKPVLHPPAHQRCRCVSAIAPPGMSEEAVRRIVNPKLPDCR